MNENDVNQEGMVRRVARRSGISQATVRTVLRAFYDEVADTLAKGGRIRITNFGSWWTNGRVTRNPHTGDLRPEKAFAMWGARGRLRGIVAGTVAPGTLRKSNPPDRGFRKVSQEVND